MMVDGRRREAHGNRWVEAKKCGVQMQRQNFIFQ
jgi:hypothetical protein